MAAMAKKQEEKQWSSDSEVDVLSLDGLEDEDQSEDSTNKPTLHSKTDRQHPLHDIDEWKARKDTQKKVETIEKIHQLKTRISAMEKEKSSQLYHKKNEFRKQFCELEEIELKLNSERKIEMKNIQGQLEKISSNVKKFQREIENAKPTPMFLEKMKTLLEETESCILRFKEQQRNVYEEMMRNEKSVSLELGMFEKKVESWARLHHTVPAAATAKETGDKDNIVRPPEVIAFEKYLLQTGGHQGGWDDYDHQGFLKLRRQYKDTDELLRNAELEIPGRSKNDIIQHDKWYNEYLLLREEKRKAIQCWRNMKQSERQEIVNKAEDTVEIEREKERRKLMLYNQERAERFAKLENWKLEKVSERQKGLEEDDAKVCQRKALELQEQKRKESIKQAAEVYKQRKREEEEILKLAEESRKAQEKESKKLTEEEKGRIRDRDRKLLEGRQARLKAKETERRETEKRLERLRSQVEVNVKRDPSRLYQLTEGWKQRKQDSQSNRDSGSNPAARLPHRAVPSWRQGLS